MNLRQGGWKGPAMMLAGYSLFAVVPIILKLCLAMGFDSPQTAVWRFVGSAALVPLLLLLGWGALKTTNLPLLLLRGTLGGASVFFWFYAMQYTTAGKGTLLNYMHSLWANIFALLILKQKPPKGFWWMLVLALVGVFIVVDPDFGHVTRGDALAFMSGIFGGGGVLTVKEARKHDSAVSVFAAFSFVGLVVSLALLCVTDHPKAVGLVLPSQGLTWAVAGAILLLGVVSGLGQVFFTEGYAQTSLGLGTLMALSVPVMASVLGWLFLGEPIGWRLAVGGSLILGACGWLGLAELRK